MYQVLPDSLVKKIVKAYKTKDIKTSKPVPFSLDVTHPHFKKHNVEWDIMQARKGIRKSKYDTQPHLIYMGLVREYEATGKLLIDGVDYYP